MVNHRPDGKEDAPVCFSGINQHSRSRHYARKGKQLFQRLETATKIENITLPFTNRGIKPGEEWIRGVILCAWLTAVISLLNVVLTVVAIGISYSKASADRQFTYAELYRGDCSVASGWTIGMHLVINVLGSALLAASNYVMQCLGAPSRADIDKAHSRREWLDIGTFSIKNLWVMDARRKCLWILLSVSSMPIHMMYNSTFFSSISTVGYGTVVIPNDLRPNEPLVRNQYEVQSFYDNVGFSAEEILTERFDGTFYELSVPDCVKQYNVDYNTEASTLLLVTGRENLRGFSSLVPIPEAYKYDDAWMHDQFHLTSGTARWDESHLWIQAGNWNYPEWSLKDARSDTWLSFSSYYREMISRDARSKDDMLTLFAFIFNHNPREDQLGDFLSDTSNWKNGSWAAQLSFRIDAPSAPAEDFFMGSINPLMDGAYVSRELQNITVPHCMAKDAEQHCQIYFSLPICLTVIVCNIIKLCCMYLAARTNHKEIFLTVGDSLSSFLDKPDVVAKDLGLMSREDVNCGSACQTKKAGISTIHEITNNKPIQQKTWPQLSSGRKRWLKAVSWKQWIVTYGLFALCLGTSLYLYFAAVALVSGNPRNPMETSFSLGSARNLGFEKPSSSTIIVPGRNLIALLLLANAPQLVFSALYLLCNGIFTRMLAVAEYNGYSTQRKPLRVSWPKGQQRSTYYLSLPYRYSFSLIAVSISMHWLLSQSIYPVKVNAFDVHGQKKPEISYPPGNSVTACGYSPLPVFVTIVVGGAAMLVLVGFSFRTLRSNMPETSYSSATISAACHPPPGDENASLKPVTWGEVSTDLENYSEPDRQHVHCTFTSKDVTTPSTFND